MNLKVVIEDNEYMVAISDEVLTNGEDFFQRMDRDMDNGWQMNREWIDNPDKVQRCQIAADRIADAISTENETLAQLMAGYIVARMPGVREVHIATDGDMMETQLI